jgi:hypothetical protein
VGSSLFCIAVVVADARSTSLQEKRRHACIAFSPETSYDGNERKRCGSKEALHALGGLVRRLIYVSSWNQGTVLMHVNSASLQWKNNMKMLRILLDLLHDCLVAHLITSHRLLKAVAEVNVNSRSVLNIFRSGPSNATRDLALLIYRTSILILDINHRSNLLYYIDFLLHRCEHRYILSTFKAVTVS